MYKSILYCIVLMFMGCDKFIEVSPPKDQILGSVVFDNEQSATAAIIGVYTLMMQSPKFVNSYMTIYCGMAADELESSNPADPFFTNDIKSENTNIDNIWSQAYNFIYAANACIYGIENSKGISLSSKNRLLGEAKFIRAYNYFYLLNIFGEIPLIASLDYTVNSIQKRTSKDSIVNQIVQDLTDAKEYLPEDYIAPLKIRPNKWTATALLSKVYLYEQLWSKGESLTTEIIDSKMYNLEADLSDVFLKESKETIWQLMPVDIRYNTMEGSLLLPYAMLYPPAWPISNHLLESFGHFDLRRRDWVDSISYQNRVYYYPRKYKLDVASVPIKEYYIVFRLAEMYLIRAECRLHLDKIAEAKEDVNIIRRRAGLPDIANSDALAENIMHERRIELAFEFGNRWFDLKRTKQVDQVLETMKPTTWKSYMELWPIPRTQILSNPFLVQNEGYN